MNLRNSKTCKTCTNAIMYGNSGNSSIQCNAIDYTYKNNFRQDKEFCAVYCKGYSRGEASRLGKLKQDNMIEFMISGNAEFILHSTKTNDDFRYELKSTKSNIKNNGDKTIYFVTITYGTDRIYAGTLLFNDVLNEFQFSTGEKGKISADKVEIRSLLFVLNRLINKQTVQFLEMYHVGRCGHCGKALTTQEDKESGFHKKCISTLNNDEAVNKQSV